MKNLAKTYRAAGIKGMGESNGGKKIITPSMKHKSKFITLPRIEGESVASWRERCTIPTI